MQIETTNTSSSNINTATDLDKEMQRIEYELVKSLPDKLRKGLPTVEELEEELS